MFNKYILSPSTSKMTSNHLTIQVSLIFLSTLLLISQHGLILSSAQSHMRPTFNHHQLPFQIPPTTSQLIDQNHPHQPQHLQHQPIFNQQPQPSFRSAQTPTSTTTTTTTTSTTTSEGLTEAEYHQDQASELKDKPAATIGAQQQEGTAQADGAIEPTASEAVAVAPPTAATGTRQLSGLMERIRSDINTLVHHPTASLMNATTSTTNHLADTLASPAGSLSSEANNNNNVDADGDDDDDDDNLDDDDDEDDDDDDEDIDDGQTAVIESEDGTRQVRDFFGNKIQMRGNSTQIIPGKSKKRDFGLLGLKAFLLAPVIGLTIKGALIKGMIWAVGMWILHLLVPGLLTTLGLGSGLVGFARQLRPDYAQLLLANLASLPDNVQHNLPPSVQKLANQYKQVFAPVIDSIQSIPEGPCRLRAVCETASHLIRHTQFMSNSLQRLSATLYLNFGTEYSKAWLDGIVSSDCGVKYAACAESPLTAVAGKLAESVRPINLS